MDETGPGVACQEMGTQPLAGFSARVSKAESFGWGSHCSTAISKTEDPSRWEMINS